jgi:DNA-binding FadR family transcriptional regulator
MTPASEVTLLRLRDFIADSERQLDGRLPPERELCALIGVSRGQLRSALARLEAEGQIWRHVGKGTFVGSRPMEAATDPEAIARRTSPAEVMRARLLIEPEVASLAALNATAADIVEMRVCLKRSYGAASWRQYESWDNRLHRVIAGATRNTLLVALLDTLTAVRRAVTWGRLRAPSTRPERDHHSFAEHEAIVAAIEDRDVRRARDLMRKHLESVERNLLARAPLARSNGSHRADRTTAGEDRIALD